jgi:hypothetical protein
VAAPTGNRVASLGWTWCVAGAVLLLAGLASRLGAQQMTSSPHGALQEECSLCHSARGWKPAHVSSSFDHGRWGFALAGAHATTTCTACHASLDFSNTPADCIACHQDVHRSELGADCSRCHTPRSFVDRAPMIRLHQATRFPLEGVHRVADCESCHTPSAQGQLTFVNRGTACEDCHLPSFMATTNPPHEASGFPRDCARCHAATTWTASRYNHNDTGFPLTGRHRALQCADCHANAVYTGAPTTCVGCHQQQYDATSNPAHAPAGFPTDCAACHTTNGWLGAKFDHQATGFTLTGQHKVIPCASCHANGVFQGAPTTCVGCHQADYDNTGNPNHLAAGFPTNCASCHTTTTWQGARFDHDASFFPIYSGSHRNQWSSCATCHTNPATFAEFTCLSCHEHSQASMDAKHQGRSGYRYDSQACFSCHPNGKSD